MTRYFFDTAVDEDLVSDDVGSDLADVGAMRSLAIAALRDLSRDHGPTAHLQVSVRDASGRTVYEAALSISERLTDAA